MRIFTLFLLTISFQISNAQSFYYDIPDSIPKKYEYDYQTTYNKIKSKLEFYKDSNITNKHQIIHEFAQENASLMKNSVLLNYVNTNWKEAEDYVLKVFKTIAPTEILSDTTFKVFIVNDPTFNAAATYDNTIYVNVGLLALIEDEAMLAYILAHEIGHLVHYDNYNMFVYHRRFQQGIPTNYILQSRKCEMNADEYAITLMMKAGYSLKSEMNANLLMEKIAEFQKKHTNIFLRPYIINTHPDNLDRVKIAEAAQIKHSYIGEKFINDSSTFYSIKKEAQLKRFEIQLQNSYYHDCIVNAFDAYLMNTNDPLIIYYLLESIRRWCLRTPELKGMHFITNGKSSSLLKNLNKGFIFSSEEDLKNAKAAELIDQKVEEFNTYHEAFEYFSKKAIEANHTESLLTIALYKYDTKEEYKPFLDNYISEKTSFYKDYAKSLLENGLKITNGTTAIVLETYFGTSKTYLKIKESKDSLFLDSWLQKYTSLNKELLTHDSTITPYVDVSDSKQNIKQLQILTQYFKTTNRLLDKKNNQYYKYAIMEPEIWTYLNSTKINKIILIDDKIKIHDPLKTKNGTTQLTYYSYLNSNIYYFDKDLRNKKEKKFMNVFSESKQLSQLDKNYFEKRKNKILVK